MLKKYYRGRFHRFACSSDYLKLDVYEQIDWVQEHLECFRRYVQVEIPNKNQAMPFHHAIKYTSQELSVLKDYIL